MGLPGARTRPELGSAANPLQVRSRLSRPLPGPLTRTLGGVGASRRRRSIVQAAAQADRLSG